MTTSRTTAVRRAVPAAVLAAALAAGPGCGSRNGGPSDYDRAMEARQGTTVSLTNSGAKITEKRYSVGTGWVVDLRGVEVTDDLLRQVKQLGNIAELDLSKTGVTDEHLRLMHEIGLHTLLARLDLNHTAVTDAGLAHLDGCIFLMELNLTGTKVTPAAVERFKKARQSDSRVRVKSTTVKL